MESVDKEGEQDSEEELLSENEEAPKAKGDDSITSKIPTHEETTLIKDDILAINMKELKAELKKQNLKISGNK